VLATGDSYVHGNEVGDAETWPAYLQTMLGRRVINGGVTGYGLDQTVLRTERLTAELRPVVVVVSFIADDLNRNERSRAWGLEKPYFSLSGGYLTLHNVPAPPSPDPSAALSFWERAFGWSVLVDTILTRLHWPETWPADSVRALPRGAGERMACPLMQRLAALSIPTLVVAQYEPADWGDDNDLKAGHRRQTDTVIRCAAEAGLAVLDTFDILSLHGGQTGLPALFEREGHLTPEGNRLTAHAIGEQFIRRGMLPTVVRPVAP
jgi:hypothetical protein